MGEMHTLPAEARGVALHLLSLLPAGFSRRKTLAPGNSRSLQKGLILSAPAGDLVFGTLMGPVSNRFGPVLFWTTGRRWNSGLREYVGQQFVFPLNWPIAKFLQQSRSFPGLTCLPSF